jgi:ketosteroid isomerase-like protein
MSADMTDYGQIAYDRLQIADALYRFAAGLDENDGEILASAFTEDAVFDGSPSGRKIGIEWPAVTGREAIVAMCASVIGPLDTSHSASNIRVSLDGDTAVVKAHLMAQHFLPGEGPRPDHTDHALLMNRVDADVVRDGDRWRLRRLTIDNAWFEGNPTVVTSAATQSRVPAEQ